MIRCDLLTSEALHSRRTGLPRSSGVSPAQLVGSSAPVPARMASRGVVALEPLTAVKASNAMSFEVSSILTDDGRLFEALQGVGPGSILSNRLRLHRSKEEVRTPVSHFCKSSRGSREGKWVALDSREHKHKGDTTLGARGETGQVAPRVCFFVGKACWDIVKVRPG